MLVHIIECHIGNRTVHKRDFYMHTLILEFMDVHNIIIYLQDGGTALFIASQNGHTAVVKLLLEAKAKPDVPNKVICTVVAVDGVVVVLE